MPDSDPMIGDSALSVHRRDRSGGWVAALALTTRDAGLADETPTAPGGAQPLPIFETVNLGVPAGTNGNGIAGTENALTSVAADVNQPGAVASNSGQTDSPAGASASDPVAFVVPIVGAALTLPAGAIPALLSGGSPEPAVFVIASQAGIALPSVTGDTPPVTIVTADSTPVPSSEIDALRTAIEQLFVTVQAALTIKVLTESLPFLGGALGSTATQVQNAVTRFQTFETGISAALDALSSQAVGGATITTDAIKAALNSAAQAAGFSPTVNVTTDAANDLVVNFANSDNLAPISLSLDSSFGLPGLGFKTSGVATTTLGYTFSGSETVTPGGALPFTDPGGALALTINVTPTIAGTADLGFLNFTADSTGKSTQASSLTGTFDIDTTGNATFTGGATLGVALKTALGSNAAFPSIGADLTGLWNLDSNAIDPNNPASFGSAPAIDLSNVTYDFGSFVNQFLTPIFKQIDAVIKPLQPALDIFNFDLTPLFDALLGSHAASLDVAGNYDPVKQDVTGDGKITLLDLLDQQNGQGAQTPALVKIVSLLNTIENFSNTFGGAAAASAQYDLGSFHIPGDIRSAIFNIASIAPQAFQQAQPLSAFLTSLAGSYSAGEISDLQQFLGGNPSQSSGSSTTDNVTLDSPLIDNPTLAAEMILSGQAADLFTLAFNATANASQTVDVPVFSLGPIANVDAYVDGAIGFQFGLDFGYDTSGLRDYATGGFLNPASIFNGFYAANPSDGSPVLGVDADIGIGVGLSVPGVSVSGGGDIAGNIGLKLDQDGKVYLNTLAAVVNTAPLTLFDLSGAVTAGLNLTASVGPFSQTLTSPRVTLIDFDTGSATDGNGNPTQTVWGLAGNGFFDVASYWQVPFTTSGDGEVRYYGASTIVANATVSLFDTRQYSQTGVLDDLTSLTILHKSSLDIDGGWVFIEGPALDPQHPAADSINIGTIAVDNIGTLSLNGSLDNIGSMTLGDNASDFATVNIGGPVRLYGGGKITGLGNVTWGPFSIPDVNSTPTQPFLDLPQLTNALVSTFLTTAELINDDNTIDGTMEFNVSLANSGTIDADQMGGTIGLFVLGGSVTNTGLLEASHFDTDSFSSHPDHFGQLDIETNTVNYGGTILASEGGTVSIGRLESVTIHGGVLKTTPYDLGLDAGQTAPVSAIMTFGTVTFDGDPTIVTTQSGSTLFAGLNIEGTVDVGGTLIVAGLIDDDPVTGTLGQSLIEATAPGDIVELHNALIEGGEFDAIAAGTSGPGTLEVVQTTTVDSGLTAPAVAFGGGVQILAGGVLTIGGEITTNPSAQARVLVNFGTVVVGLPEIHLLTGTTNDIKDTAALVAQYPLGVANGATYVQGDLKLVDGGTNLVTGFNASSILQNDWTIEGAGTLGAGTLQIVNLAATTAIAGLFTVPGGTIDANGTHSLIVNSGSRGVINQSLMEATNGGELDLTGNVNNTGGTIASNGGVVSIDGATIAGGLLTQSLGLFLAGGLSGLDGSASALTIDTGLLLSEGANGFLTLKGAIVNRGTIQIQATAANLALVSVDQSATLSGGGELRLIDPIAAPGVGHAGLSAASGAFTLDNLDNLIDGTGIVSAVITNETAGVIASGNGVLSVTGTVANAGLMQSASGELWIDGLVQNLQGTVAAEGGQVVLSGGTIANSGGLILLSGGSVAIGPGTIEAMSRGGKSGTITLGGVVKGGFIVTDATDPNSIVRAGAAGGMLDGSVSTVTLSTGSRLLIGTGDTFSVTGTLSNQGSIGIDGDVAAATLQIVGNAVLTGGGSITLSDLSGANITATQIVTGINSATLDNVDNTISGIGLLGNGSVKLTNEIGGHIFARGGTLAIDGGSAGFINHGQVTATTASTLVLAGNVFDAGDTLVADGGTIVIRGAIAGGTFATPNGGKILSDSGTLDGRASPVTIPNGVTVNVLADLPSPGVNATLLEGTIANLGEIFLQSDSSKAGNKRSLLLGGIVRLTGGGLIAMSDLGTAAADSILGSTGTDTLDNVDNRIVGFGTIGASGTGALTLTNESAGTVDATGGELFLNLFAPGNHSSNQGLIEAVGGTIDLSGTIANAGGTIQTLNDGTPHSGTILFDGLTVTGGQFAGDPTDPGSLIETTTKNATLDGTANPVTIASTGQLQVVHDSKLTLLGSIVDQGTIAVIGVQEAGASFGTGDANIAVSGTVTLSGSGSIIMSHIVAPGNWIGNQIVAGKSMADQLNNGATIAGTGSLGNNALTLINLAAGVVSASGGTLFVDTGIRFGSTVVPGGTPTVNKGLLTAASTGTLDLRSDVANTGGTIGASDGGITYLDNMIVTGGTFEDTGDGEELSRSAAIDGSGSSVTLLPGARVGVAPLLPVASDFSNLLTINGTFINHGTIFVEGPSGGANSRTILVSGSVNLSGGGQVQLIDTTPTHDGFADKLIGDQGTIVNVNASNTLDNVDNLISGAGLLGNVSLTIVNEAAGTVSATGGTLRLNTESSNSIASAADVVNKGTIEASGGTLDLSATVDNRGGVIRAINDGLGHSGTVILDNAVVSGGSLASDPNDPASYIFASTGSLDGSLGTVTLGSGTPLRILPRGKLTITGAIANLGTVLLQGDAVHGASASLMVSGTAHLSGGGRIQMSDLSGVDDWLNGALGTDTLDNIDNTIAGFGRIGFDALSLRNEAAGTIAAQGGTLFVAPSGAGSTGVTNLGLMEALGSTLDLGGTVANAGGTIAARNDGAGHSGTVVLDAVTIQGGVLTGDTTDPGSVITATNSTGNILDGQTNAVTIASSAQLQIGPTEQVTLKGTISDRGSIALSAAQSVAFFGQAILRVAGTATVSGGGTISLTDYSGNGGTATQIVTGTVKTDTLDNAGVTISGVGLLGDGVMTLINEAAGIISASGGSLVVDTGTIAVVNHGRMGAVAGGTLDIKSRIDNSGGTVGGGGGIVLIDNSGEVSGGTLNGEIDGYFGTIDGVANTVTIAANATLAVLSTIPNASSKPLYLKGTIANLGTMLLRDDDSGLTVNADFIVAGTVSLTGGGLVSLTGNTAKDTGTGNFFTGSVLADTLDNVDNTVAGFGKLGNGTMTLINEAAGTVNAMGGTLTVYTASAAIVNRGLLTSGAGGVLDVLSTIDNAGGTIGADGGMTTLDNITVQGGSFDSSRNGTILIPNTTTLDGTSNGVVLASGALLEVAANSTLTLSGAVANHGTILNGGSITNNSALVLDGTLINNGSLSGGVTLTGAGNLTNNAGKTVPGAAAAAASGETIFNLGTIAGAVSLAGGDRLVTGKGAVFTGGISGGTGGNTLEIATGPFTLTNFNAAGTPQYSTLQIDAGVTVTPDATDILTGVTLINHGNLNLTAFTASAPVSNDGDISGDVTLTSGVPLINAAGGTISGNGLAAIEAIGLASVVNSGVIDPAADGVDLTAGGTVTNTAGGVIEGTVTGVSISGGPGTVTNGGTIIGGGTDAVSLAAGFTDLVVINPGAVFVGIVDGGNPVGGPFASTVELAGTAGSRHWPAWARRSSTSAPWRSIPGRTCY